MDKEEYERRQKEIAEHAASEGADYFDPDSPVIWKRYIIGPVPRWRRVWWWFFPPSHAKMRGIMRQQSDQMWQEATGNLTGPQTLTAGAVVRTYFLCMAAPVILSLPGPIYFGFTGGPYRRVVVWALACVVAYLWWARPSFKYALSTAPPSVIYRSLLIVAIVAVTGIALVAGDSLVYLLTRSLAK